MTLLSVAQSVCAVVGVAKPTAVFASINTDRTMFEMLENANEMATRIATDARDWTMLRNSAILTGDSLTEAFPLPPNYRRMLTNSNVWRSTSTMQPMRFIPDTDEWLQRRAANQYDGRGEWTIYGGNIHIQPIMGVGTTARFSYLDRGYINQHDPSTGLSVGTGDVFMTDADTFRLDERLLKLGMIWSWKQLKGSPYAEDMGTYQDAISWAMGTDSPAPIIIGRQPFSAADRVAYPFYPVPS